MKHDLRKVSLVISSALIINSICTINSIAKDKQYTKEELQNRKPGWSEEDKNKSEVNVNSFNNNFSNDSDKIEIKDDKNGKDDDTDVKFDQIGESAVGYSIQRVSVITGTNDSWALLSNGKWMLLKSGEPAIGWKYVNGSWYYMNSDGIMQTGWVNLNGTWYYLYSDGTMAYNTYIDGYYLSSSGAMI